MAGPEPPLPPHVRERRRTLSIPPNNPYVWLMTATLIGVGFLAGYLVGRESDGADRAITPGPTASPTVGVVPGEPLNVDAAVFSGLWLFQFTETQDSCGRYPAAYSDQMTVAAGNEQIRLPESVPAGAGVEPEDDPLQASGSVSPNGVFEAAAQDSRTGPDGRPETRSVRYNGSFSTVAAAEGSYRIERGDCTATFDFEARRLA